MKKIFILLRIEADEQKSVTLIMLLSFFLGIFNGTFYIGSHSQFLDTFGKDEIANAYVISGLVGIVMTFIYSFFQARISFAALSKWNLIVITLIAFGLRLSYDYADPKTVDFAYFVLYGPLNIIAVVAFWGMVNRIYSLRQGKRLFGIIDAGIIFGIIISSISIPLIPIIFGYTIDLRDLIYVSSASTFLAFFFQWVIARKYLKIETVSPTINEDRAKEKSSISLLKLFRVKYTRAMAFFVGVSVVVAFFAQFSFMAVAEERYSDAYELANFLGVFTTALMIVTFIIKTFVYNRLIDSFGLRTSLILLPLIMLLLTVGAVLIGTFSELTIIEGQGFLTFFLIISLSKLLAQSLKEGIELPSFKLLYHSVKSNIRHDVQAKIDGTVNEIFALISGGLLALLGMFSFVEIEHYTDVLFVIIVLWVFTAIRLYKEYKNSLKNSLDAGRVDRNNAGGFDLTASLKTGLSGGTADTVINALALIRRVDVLNYSQSLAIAYENKSEKVCSHVEQEIFDRLDLVALDLIKKPNSEKQVLQVLREKVSTEIKKLLPVVHDLSVSADVSKRRKAAIVLRSASREESSTILYRLIRDLNAETKTEAIVTAALNSHVELAISIAEMLSDARFGNIAYAALKMMGDPVLDVLEVSFYKTGIDQQAQLRLIELIGLCKTKKAEKVLLKKISYPHKSIVFSAIEQLEIRNSEVAGDTEYMLLNVLNELIGSIALILSVSNFIDEEMEHSELLKRALERELSNNYSHLFSVLKLLYDAKSVSYVEENLKDGSPESIGFAMELMELFISDNLKPKLFPLFEDIPLVNKIKKLADYFPIEHVDQENCLRVILSHDITEISSWSKCVAMHTQNEAIEESLLSHFKSNIFGRSPILYETAGYLLSKNNENALLSVSDRLSHEKNTAISKLNELVSKESGHLLFEKMKSITNHAVFGQMIMSDKLLMAELMNLVSFGTEWASFDNLELIFVVEGSVRLRNSRGIMEFSAGSLIYLEHHKRDELTIISDSNAIVYGMGKGSFTALINSPGFVKQWLLLDWNGKIAKKVA